MTPHSIFAWRENNNGATCHLRAVFLDASSSRKSRLFFPLPLFPSPKKRKKRKKFLLVESRNEMERFGNDSVSSNILHTQVRLFFVPHDSPYFSSNFPVSHRLLLLLLLPCRRTNAIAKNIIPLGIPIPRRPTPMKRIGSHIHTSSFLSVPFVREATSRNEGKTFVSKEAESSGQACRGLSVPSSSHPRHSRESC